MWVHIQASCASDSQASCASDTVVKHCTVSRCDDLTVLAQNMCVFYGEENCRVVTSWHCITRCHILNACANACVPILNQHVVPYSYTCSKRCNDEHRSLISSVPKRMCFLWRWELIKRRRSSQHTLKKRSVCCWKLTMRWQVPTAMQFLPKHHTICMEERIARSSALSTTLSIRHHDVYAAMWGHTQWIDLCG
jgi:hypothetical protein